MKLLLDEMYPATIAVALRDRGFDVVAVQEDDALREFSDEAVFAVAREEDRVVVTENAKDFAPIEARVREREATHPGLIFTHNRSFPRHRQQFIGAMINALQQLLDDDSDCGGMTLWLRPSD